MVSSTFAEKRWSELPQYSVVSPGELSCVVLFGVGLHAAAREAPALVPRARWPGASESVQMGFPFLNTCASGLAFAFFLPYVCAPVCC